MKNKIIEANKDNFEKLAKEHSPAAVFFYAQDCLPCEAFSPMFERIAENHSDKINFITISLPHNREIAKKYNVKGSPAVVFLREGKEVCGRLTGYISRPEFINAVESVSGGLCRKKERGKVHTDVLILGAGPAGLSTAIYTSRAKLMTTVAEENLPGGQVATTYHVANYPGTNGVVRGMDLMDNMRNQAENFGAVIHDMTEIEEIKKTDDGVYVKAENAEYYARVLVAAMGATPRKLPAQGEEKYRGRGVHYCATCDGAMYQDQEVVVVGGGNSAVEEAVFLTRYASHVTIVHHLDHLQAARSSAQEALDNTDIDIIWNHRITKITGEDFVSGIEVEDVNTGEIKKMDTDGVFVYIGLEPMTNLLTDLVKLNDYGYVCTDEDMMTSEKGIFAIGDMREKKVRQIATAVGDGVTAGVMIEKFINSSERDVNANNMTENAEAVQKINEI